MLLFDGDSAGRRAAYRAVDMALPRLAPGKSLLFASLPEGQDPDDLVRSGGRAAIVDVLAAARPLAEVLWMRETEAGRFDTPERRAGLEARIGEVTAVIGHDAVRKYYRQDLEGRIRSLFAPAARTPEAGRYRNYQPGGDRRARGRSPERGRPENLSPLSPRLGASSIVRGARSALPAREALILLALVNHPWLLESHSEDVSALEFQHPDADQLRRAILDAGADQGLSGPDDVRNVLEKRELLPLLGRIERAVTHQSDWPAHAGGAADDINRWWTHVVTLHRKARTLNKELKEAERALGEDPSDQNLAWLRDVQGRLSALDGTEASIEGFGVLSGHPARSL